MKKAVLLALLLGGCQTQASSDRQSAEAMCRNDRDQAQCVETHMRNYAILDKVAVGRQAAPPTYYPETSQAPMGSDAPVLQNIIPPTTRCQSVPAGMGTVQTICR